MGLFDNLEGEAEKALGNLDHDKIEQAVQAGENVIKEKTGHKFDSQIDQGGEQITQKIEEQIQSRSQEQQQ